MLLDLYKGSQNILDLPVYHRSSCIIRSVCTHWKWRQINHFRFVPRACSMLGIYDMRKRRHYNIK